LKLSSVLLRPQLATSCLMQTFAISGTRLTVFKFSCCFSVLQLSEKLKR